MRSFTDTAGRTWKIALDPWLVNKVRDETQILLTAWADDKFSLPIRLRQEPWLLCDVLWAICDEQAAANGCKETAEKSQSELPREFARGLGGNILIDALDALEGGIADFFMSQEESQARATLLEKAKQVNELMGKRLLAEMTAIDPAQVAKSYLDSVSVSPESPESTPSPERSPSGT